MDKLIELLREYNIELHWVDRAYKDGFNLAYEQEYMRDFRVAYLISKQFWFIKRLVDSDKIGEFSRKDVRYPYYLEDGLLLQCYWESDSLIMLLAISDNPIEDLISYLK